MKHEKLIPAAHIGDGIYLIDKGYCVAIASGHHENEIAYIDAHDLNYAIEYLNKVKKRIEEK